MHNLQVGPPLGVHTVLSGRKEDRGSVDGRWSNDRVQYGKGCFFSEWVGYRKRLCSSDENLSKLSLKWCFLVHFRTILGFRVDGLNTEVRG